MQPDPMRLMAIEKLKDTSPGVDKIPAELIKARGRSFRFESHKRINSIWKKEEYALAMEGVDH